MEEKIRTKTGLVPDAYFSATKIVWILENHTNLTADSDQLILIGRVQPADPNLAAGGQQNGIEMLGQGGFSAAVGAQDGHKGAFFHGQIHIFKHHNTRLIVHTGVGIGKIFNRNNIAQNRPLPQGVQRPVAPQGRIRPDSLTGRPSSPASVLPPYLEPKTTSEAYATAEGARPVV